MDLSARQDITIAPGATIPVPLNVAIAAPPGFFVLLAARSSLFKRGLAMANGVGIIDEDYAGDADEYHAILRNVTDEPVSIGRGERIVQMIVLPFEKAVLTEVENLGGISRGGIGSTGI